MTWTTPRTWVTSEVVTASIMNTHVRDNLSELRTLHGCRVTKNATQSIATGSDVAVTFQTETYDTDGFHDTGANTERITVPSGLGGYYQLRGKCQWAAAAGGFRRAKIRLNGTTILEFSSMLTGNTSETVGAQTVENLAVGDYVELIAEHNQGAGLNVVNGRDATVLEARFVGA